MLNHADRYSKAFSAEKYRDLQDGKLPKSEMWKYSSPWYSGFDGMALKTVVRQLLGKYGILSVEMVRAFESDMSMVNEDGSFDYIDNQPDEPQDDLVDANVTITEENADDGSGLSEADKAEIMAAEAAQSEVEQALFG